MSSFEISDTSNAKVDAAISSWVNTFSKLPRDTLHQLIYVTDSYHEYRHGERLFDIEYSTQGHKWPVHADEIDSALERRGETYKREYYSEGSLGEREVVEHITEFEGRVEDYFTADGRTVNEFVGEVRAQLRGNEIINEEGLMVEDLPDKVREDFVS